MKFRKTNRNTVPAERQQNENSDPFLSLYEFSREVLMQLLLLHMCCFDLHPVFQHVDVVSLSVHCKDPWSQLKPWLLFQIQGLSEHRREPTSVSEGLDVKGQVNVHALCVLHLLKDDPDEPHGNKFIPAAEKQSGT